MAAVTLAEFAQLEKQPLKKGILLGLAMESVVLDLFRWRSIDGLSETGVRYDGVNEPDWIPLGGAIASKKTSGKPIAWSVYQMALHIDVPRLLEKQAGDVLQRQSVRQTQLSIKGAAYQMNNTFINGDQSADPNQFQGLNRLVAELDSGQTIGATEIDLTASYTDALAESLFFRLDEGIYAVDGHNPKRAFANSTFLRRMESFGRQSKMAGSHFNWMDAPFAVGDVRQTLATAATRPAFMYRNIPFYDLGKKADQSTLVIGDTYTEGGSTAHGTRIFLCADGEDQLEGIQAEPFDVKEVGPLEDTDTLRWRGSGTFGLALWNPRALVKIQGIRAI